MITDGLIRNEAAVKKGSRASIKNDPRWSFLVRRAVRYLSRYPASETRFRLTMRRALMKRDERQSEKGGPSLDVLLDAITGYVKELGLIDDAALARGLVASYRRRGDSLRMIRQKLARKGVQQSLIARLLSEESVQTELSAARQYAEKHRLGVFGTMTDGDSKQRALRRMARRGFSYGVAKAALEWEQSE